MAKKRPKEIDQLISDAAAFKTTEIDGDVTVTNHSLSDLIKYKREAQREEEAESGTRGSVATFNLRNQDF